jgi:hypothetical protein
LLGNLRSLFRGEAGIAHQGGQVSATNDGMTPRLIWKGMRRRRQAQNPLHLIEYEEEPRLIEKGYPEFPAVTEQYFEEQLQRIREIRLSARRYIPVLSFLVEG